jgi:glycosyltransferase involved in cell wall biosynthesis
MVTPVISTTDSPLVSVVMPVYNAALYLQESINSILTQSYENFEFLIYNDGSSDESAKIIYAAAAIDSRIKFFDSKTNYGYVTHLNSGLKQAKGKYIARFDADDISDLNRFAEQVAYLEANPAVGICGSAVHMFGPNDESIIYLPEDNKLIQSTIWLQNVFFHPAVMIRRSVLRDNALQYREEYMPTEDYQLWCEVSQVAELHNLPSVLLNYRAHEQQISRRKRSDRYRITVRIRLEHMSRLGIVLPKEQYKYFAYFNTPTCWRHLSLVDYKGIISLMQELYQQTARTGLSLDVAKRLLLYQWNEIIRAAGHYQLSLLPIVMHQPLESKRKLLNKSNLSLAAKCLISWRPNLPTYLKRYWRRRLSW